MKINALVTTLVLGSSSIALASSDVRDHRTHAAAPAILAAPAPAPVLQARFGFGFGAGYQRPVRPVSWVTLASSTHVDGREMIAVAPTHRTFSKVELRSNNGRTRLDKIMIQFANGRSQVLDYNTVLAGKQSLSIDLEGNARSIKRIVIIGTSRGRASLDVLAI